MDLGGINNKLKKLLGILVLGSVLVIYNVALAKSLLPDISGYDKWVQESIEGKCSIKKRHFGPVEYIACINGEVSGLSKISPLTIE